MARAQGKVKMAFRTIIGDFVMSLRFEKVTERSPHGPQIVGISAECAATNGESCPVASGASKIWLTRPRNVIGKTA
jgi:hypothetical protein